MKSIQEKTNVCLTGATWISDSPSVSVNDTQTIYRIIDLINVMK